MRRRPAERATCAPWLDAEWRLAGADVRVVIALGGFAWRAALDMVRAAGGSVGRPLPKFGHGAAALVQTPHGEVTLLGCYHPSQQNTFTGKLTPEMLDDVFGKAAELVGIKRFRRAPLRSAQPTTPKSREGTRDA